MASSAEPFVLRWGIVAAGWISSMVVKDLLLDPKTRGVHDVVHKVVAVGSRDTSKAQIFIDEHAGVGSNIQAYGTYEEVYSDPVNRFNNAPAIPLTASQNVDVVYVGSPHTHHFSNAAAALRARKHVLCEKPVAVSSAELHELLRLAKENGVFLMEALWTRFQPIANAVKKVAEDPALGELRVLCVYAEGAMSGATALLSNEIGVITQTDIPKTHRILDPDLGGGALLDLGPYPLVWTIMTLYERPQNNLAKPSKITGTMLKTPLTGVDSCTTYVLNFDNIEAQAILSDSILIPTPEIALTIRFRGGMISIPHPLYRPRWFKVQYFKPGTSEVAREVTRGPEEFAFEGGGWQFEADEVARCIREGKSESEVWSWERSKLEIEIFDEVRRQGGYVFPPGVGQVV